MAAWTARRFEMLRCAAAKTGRWMPRFAADGPAADALRAWAAQEVVAKDKQVGQRAGHEQALCVLLQPAVAHLGEPEHALDHPNGVLNLRPNFRLGAVL